MHAPFPSTIAIKISKQAQLPFAAKTTTNLATAVGPSPSPSPSPPPDDNRMDLTGAMEEEAHPADPAAAVALSPAPVSAAPPAAPAVPTSAPVKEKLSKVSKKPLFIFGRHVKEVKLAGTRTGYTSVARAYTHLGDALK